MSGNKIGVLCKKDIVDLVRKPGMLIGLLIPVFFAILYQFIGMDDASAEEKSMFILNLCTMLNCSMGGLVYISGAIAEEKEKFTLRTLMLSNISGSEFLTAKMLIGVGLTLIGNVLVFLLSKVPMSGFGFYLLGTTLCAAAVNLLSAVIGIVSKDQNSVTSYQIPLMFLLLLPSAFEDANNIFATIAKVTPFSSMMKIYLLGISGKLASASGVQSILVLFAWIVLGVVAFLLAYRKRGLDN